MTQLSPKAESLRQEIKQMISDAVPKKDPTEISQQTVFIVDAIGNKSYEGELLKKKVTLLMEEMGYEQGWGWDLAYFPRSGTPIINRSSRMYIIALSNLHLNPGGDLSEGFAKYVTDEPKLSLPSTILFIIPPP